MIEKIISIDRNLFFAINGTHSSDHIILKILRKHWQSPGAG